jgi:hypothetical protein
MKVPWTLQKLLIRVIKNSNKKLLEVQEPFLEKVPGRRRQNKKIRIFLRVHLTKNRIFSRVHLAKYRILCYTILHFRATSGLN